MIMPDSLRKSQIQNPRKLEYYMKPIKKWILNAEMLALWKV